MPKQNQRRRWCGAPSAEAARGAGANATLFFFREHWIRSTRPNAIQSLSGTDSRRRGSFPCEEWQERFPGKQGVVGDRRLTGGCVRTIRSQHAGILVDDPGC